jgi:hypothetical protein
MGLGKTVTIIALMVRQKKPTLLVLPPHLIPQWSAEITEKAPGLLCTVVASPDFKESEPFTDADVVIMPTSLFQKLSRPQLDLLKAKEIQRIVCSETCRQASLWRDYLSGGAQFLVDYVHQAAGVHRSDLRCSSPYRELGSTTSCIFVLYAGTLVAR